VAAGSGLSLAAPDAGGRSTGISKDPALHAARRLTFGPTPEVLSRIRQVGVAAWVDEQLRPELIPDPEVERVLALFPSLRMTSSAIARAYADNRHGLVNELGVAAIVRSAWSERQLYEVLVDFWTQHFNVFIGHDMAYLLKTVDDREVVRAHAVGRFADLLVASAKSPAMLAYLDNWLSSGSNPNENYARELLELHTLGVDGGYTENDVKNAARVLTGWTFSTDYTFQFRPEWHYTGPVRVLGWRHDNKDPAQGLAVGESMLNYLARHPSTARFLARKLAIRLVGDKPSGGLVAQAAKAYLANDTAIAPMVRTIVLSGEFAKAVGYKVRRPNELLAATIRALGLRWDLGARSDAGGAMLALLLNLGQFPYGYRSPDGYPDRSSAWLSTLAMLNRWNMCQRLARGEVAGTNGPRMDRSLLSTTPTTAGQLVDAVGERLLFQQLPAADRAALLGYLKLAPNAAVTPAFVNDRTPALAGLVLSSPIHQLR
jgi:uncharacterized protein (DUF1800 family)